MANTMYKDLDFSSIVYGDVISSSDALSDVEPIRWPDSVLDGEDKIFVFAHHKKGDEDEYAVT